MSADRAADAPKSAPPPGSLRLSRQVIVDAYLRITDAEGTDDITLRRLGAELRVDPTAVYRHFRDKGEILAVASDRVLAEATARLEPSGSWREELRALQVAVRRAYLSHPKAMLALQASPASMPAAERLTDRAIGLLRRAGLHDAEAAVAYEALENYTIGTALFDAGATEESLEGWRRVYASAPTDRHPNLAATASLLYRDPDHAYEYGLDLMLDGLERSGRDARGDPPGNGPKGPAGKRRRKQ